MSVETCQKCIELGLLVVQVKVNSRHYRLLVLVSGGVPGVFLEGGEGRGDCGERVGRRRGGGEGGGGVLHSYAF